MKKNNILSKGFCAFALCLGSLSMSAQERPDTMWFQFDDRFIANEVINISVSDSIAFAEDKFLFYRPSSSNPGTSFTLGKNYRTDGVYRLDEQERFLLKPSTYSGNDFTSEASQFCFQRSAESEHFVIYWAKGLTKQNNGNIVGGASSSVCNVNTLLNNAEKIWDVYVDQLGFIEPGNSKTDKLKVAMFIVNQSDWRADGSGVDGQYWKISGSSKTAVNSKTGMFHCNPWAASDNVTVAHEIGHTFQYLVSADLGMDHGLNYVLGDNSTGNEWWEDCANWQAHKVYPAAQFASNWSNNQNIHHLNILHEDGRYNNCYYHDWWVQQHGLKVVSRIWRESVRPECPIKAYMRIFGLNEQTFADEQFTGYAHIAAMDIDSWKTYGQGLIGSEQQRLKEVPKSIQDTHLNGDNTWWIVDADYCPQNYGYNANPLKVPAAGTEVKAQFKGLAGCAGYRSVNTEYAGWRYGLVAYSSDGTRTYGEMGRDKEGEVSITVPENCTHLWLVVMGAPTTYWTHGWDSNVSNDEQWPYAVKFTGTDPYGASRSYGDYPDDYRRKDTTVVINANLSYSGFDYTSVRVQYDMDAISQALGLSTATLKAVKPGEAYNPRFVAVGTNGKVYTNTTTTSSSTVTSTASDRKYGHWFNVTGNVCNYDSNAHIFAELYPEGYGCYIGQYPGRLTKGKTYTIRQAIIYKHTDGKEYRATMVVNIKVV